MRAIRLIAILISLLCAACSTHVPKSLPPVAAAKARKQTERVWLVSNGFHSSLAIEARQAEPALQRLYPGAKYLVIGWGGRSIYMAPKFQPWHVIQAGLVPTDSALHVVPVQRNLCAELTRSEIVEFNITKAGMRRLTSRFRHAFSHDKDGNLIIRGKGKTPNSHFFAGTQIYFFPRTCNQWSARGLAIAGVPLFPCAAIAADNLIWQASKHGRVLRRKARPLELL